MRYEPQMDGKLKVNQALKVGEVFEEDARPPVLLYVPIVLLVISAMDHVALMFNREFTETFLRKDQTLAFVGGLLFGSLMIVAVLGLYRQRRWAVWLVLGTLLAEVMYTFIFYAGGDTAVMQVMRTPVMNWMGSDNVTLMGTETGMSSGAAYWLRTLALALIMIPYVWLTE